MKKETKNILDKTLRSVDFNSSQDIKLNKKMPQEEQNSLQNEITSYIRSNRRKDDKSPDTFRGSRLVLNVTSQPVFKQGDLFDIIKGEGLKVAKMLYEKKELTTIDKYGIDCSPMAQKLIIAICKFLYIQSSRNGKFDKSKPTGVKDFIYSYIEKNDPELLEPYKKGKEDQIYKTTSKGEMLGFPTSYIQVTRTELTKETKGKKRISGKDTEVVMDALWELDRLRFCFNFNGKNVWSKAITLEMGELNSNEPLLIRLYPIFGVLSKDYVEYPIDILERISKFTKKIEMQLFNYLMLTSSYELMTGDSFMIDKRNLLEIIAIAKRYKDHPKELASDYANAVQKVKDIGLIKDYQETPHKEGIGTVCTFIFNRNFARGEKKISDK